MAEMETMYNHRDANDNRYTYKGVGGAGLGLGIAGTALGLLNGGLGLMNGMNGGWGGYGYNNNYGGAVCIDKPVGRETFELQQKVSALEAERSLLKSESETEVKIATVYEKVAKQALDLERQENRKWTEQLVWNARQDSRLAVLERDVSQLFGMTGLYIEASKVTPLPMRRYNSFVTPTTPAPDAAEPQA